MANCCCQAHPYYYLVRLARIGVSGTDIDAPEVCTPMSCIMTPLLIESKLGNNQFHECHHHI